MKIYETGRLEMENMKIRVKFSKYGAVKFIGHLDVMRYFQKAIRRAEIDIAYSEGFSPHQIMSFAAPLSVGHTSEGEYFDIEVNSYDGCEDLKNRLQEVMVKGIDVLAVKELTKEDGNAMASVAAASYLVSFRKEADLPKGWQEKLAAFYEQPQILVIKPNKKGKSEKEIDLKESIYALDVRAGVKKPCEEEIPSQEVYMLLNASSAGNIKPGFVLEKFFETMDYTLPEFALKVHRLDTYQNIGTDEKMNLVPLIWEK